MYLESMHGALQNLTRRQALGGAMGLAMTGGMAMTPDVAAASSPAAAAAASGRALDLTRPEDNIHAFAKTWGTLGDEPVFGGHEGVFFAVVGDRRAMPLFGYVGFGSLQFRI